MLLLGKYTCNIRWVVADLMGLELIRGNKTDKTRPCRREGAVLLGMAVVLRIRRYSKLLDTVPACTLTAKSSGNKQVIHPQIIVILQRN